MGAGAAGFLTDTGSGLQTTEMTLNIGPQHPATHGVLRLALTLDGDRIVRAEPIVGYMHRGAEKLFEVRDYRQILVLANRHDWLSAFSNELGVVLAVERMLGMEVPERAMWTRTLLAELNRVLNHLMFLGSYPLEIGAIDPGLVRLRRARGDPGRDGGGLRRPDALHVQPGRRPQGGPAGRLARARRRAVADVRARPRRPRGPRRRQRDLPRPYPRRRRADRPSTSRSTASPARSPAPPASTSTCAATSRTSRTASCRTRCGSSPVPRATAWPGSSACSSRSRSRSTSPTPASTGWPSCHPDRSTSGCRRSSRRPRARPTPGPRTRWESTATTSSRAARGRPGG